MKTSIETKLNVSLLIIRVTVGFIILAHGVQKLFGWFGGYGFTATMNFFTEYVGLPYLLGLAIIIAETLGMLALIGGIFSRFLAASTILIMLGAIATTHYSNGFFMNWGGSLPGEGFEFHLLVIVMAAIIAAFGAGRFSLEKWIRENLWKKQVNDGMFFI